MNIDKLLNKAAHLVGNAWDAHVTKQDGKAYGHLVELRELLNDQPELEAGGAHNPDKSTQGGNHEN